MRKLSVGVAVSLILVGCGGGGSGNNTTNTASSTNSTSNSVPAKDPLKILTGENYDAGDADVNPRWVIADFNKDGSKDIFLRYDPQSAFSATKLGTPSPVRFFLGKAGGGFDRSTSIFPEGFSAILVNRIILSDFNGDGGTDILIAASGQDPYVNGKPALTGYTGEYTTILSYTPNGYKISKINNNPLTFAHHASSGDINGDYLPDAFITSLGFSEPFFIKGDNNGNFIADTSRFPSKTFSWQYSVLERFADGSPKKWQNNFVTSTAMVDANSDGHIDVVAFAASGNKTSKVYLNDGAGNFSSQRLIELPAGPYGEGYESYDAPNDGKKFYSSGTIHLDSLVADINGDGKMDLLSLTTSSKQSVSEFIYYRGAAIQALINTGNGFVDESKSRINFTHNTSINYTHYDTLEFADINNDKCKDILIHRHQFQKEDNANPTRILINNCKGNFSEKSYPASLPKGILTVLGEGHYAVLISQSVNGVITQRVDDVYYDWSLGQNLFP